MVQAIRISAAVLVLVLAACAPVGPAPQVLPTFVPTAEAVQPAPNESYPTAQAAEQNESQSSGGFSMNLRRAWRDGKQVNADLCFTLPDSSDWTVWAAHYEYGGNSISEFSSAFLSKEEGQGGQPAQRCDELSFYVPPDADLSGSTLTVESVGAYPSMDEYCSVYMPKIQQSLVERGIAITLDCPEVDGVPSMQIMSKPEGMTQDEAEQLVFSDEFYTVRGPWTFPVTFNQ